MDMTIKKTVVSGQSIPQRAVMKRRIIPAHPSRLIINGQSNSGKSNLVAHMIRDGNFYGPKQGQGAYFDKIFLLKGSGDECLQDVVDNGHIKPENVILDPKDSDLEKIFNDQNEIVMKKGVLKAPRTLVIVDDMANDNKFMKGKVMSGCFIKSRPIGMSIWLLTQYVNKVDKTCRMNANWVIIFPCTHTEEKLMHESYGTRGVCKKTFSNIMNKAFEDQYSFLVIDKQNPDAKMRLRKRFEEVLFPDDFKPQ